MKKSLLIALMAIATTAASAQTVSLSTYQGTDITKYDRQVKNVSVFRHVFTGWNTISLPFAMSADKVDEVFGSDCRLEKLVGVESDGAQIRLNFMDCKAEGIQANVPYILYYNGETASKKIAMQGVELKNEPAKVTFWDINGVEVTFAAAQKHRTADGVYGILARDNSEAAFVNVSDINTGFYATRCFIELSNGTQTILKTNHLTAGDATSITAVLKGNEKADVYNVSGVKIADALTAESISQLPSGIYIVNGKKIAVR